MYKIKHFKCKKNVLHESLFECKTIFFFFLQAFRFLQDVFFKKKTLCKNIFLQEYFLLQDVKKRGKRRFFYMTPTKSGILSCLQPSTKFFTLINVFVFKIWYFNFDLNFQNLKWKLKIESLLEVSIFCWRGMFSLAGDNILIQHNIWIFYFLFFKMHKFWKRAIFKVVKIFSKMFVQKKLSSKKKKFVYISKIH